MTGVPTGSPPVDPSAATASPTPKPANLRAVGDRIESLLEASSAAGSMARERAEELVRLVVELYGAGLERTLEILYEAGSLSDEALDRLAEDELVASLLLVHGLHPHGVATRVELALEKVRPYLGSHGGDVELLDVSDEGVVGLRLLGSCDGCPSSAVTLKLAVEDAIRSAAPEVVDIRVETPEASPAPAKIIPVESLSARLHSAEAPDGGGWEAVPGLADLPAGSVRNFSVAGLDIAVCRVGRTLYAYREGCPECGSTLAGSALERAPGAPLGSAVLRCRGCGSHYDVARAGAGVDTDRRLDPLPLLERDGGVQVAVPAGAAT